jgi:hypothetical protein
MTIGSTFTSGDLESEWSLGFPFSSAELAAVAGIGSAFTSADLVGLSAFSVSIPGSSYMFSTENMFGTSYFGGPSTSGTCTPSTGITTSYLSLSSTPPLGMTNTSATPVVLANNGVASVGISLSGYTSFNNFSGSWSGSFTARFTYNGVDIDIPVTWFVSIGGGLS